MKNIVTTKTVTSNQNFTLILKDTKPKSLLKRHDLKIYQYYVKIRKAIGINNPKIIISGSLPTHSKIFAAN
jgi:hypothetical protein